jgi:hypothetical protein
MASYRDLISAVQKNAGVQSSDEALSTVAYCVRALALQLSPSEFLLVRQKVPAELRQILTAARSQDLLRRQFGHGAPDMVRYLTTQLEISEGAAKTRLIALLTELNSDASVWDESGLNDLLQRLRRDIENIPAPIAAA